MLINPMALANICLHATLGLIKNVYLIETLGKSMRMQIPGDTSVQTPSCEFMRLCGQPQSHSILWGDWHVNDVAHHKRGLR